ncbi:MAG: dienelactone hydrolase family protein [Nitrososphaerota archaeon]|nr:dienelactone hydrolase family protein [Nitrososphaerota archaeon]
MEIDHQDLTFKCSDGTDMVAFLSRPKNANEENARPGVIVIHEAYGLNEQIKGVARRYAEQGFVAIAPNLFTRNSNVMNEKNIESAMRPMWAIPPEKRSDPSAIQELMKSMTETQGKVVEIFFKGREKMEEQMIKDLLSCKDFVQHLAYVKKGKLGVTGFCLGGGLTFQLSTVYSFGACIPFYGANPKPLESIERISSPILAFYAGEDSGINSGLPSLVEAMVKHKKDFQMKLYKGANHSFFNETRPVYNKDAANDAWESAVSFFNKHLTK